MHFYWLVLGVLGVWRITHLLQAENGPWEVAARLRRKGSDTSWKRLLDCFYCLSLWIAVPFALGLGEDWKERVLLWPALSAAAILLERLTMPATAAYVEEKEDDHVLLRAENDQNGHGRPPAA